MRRSELPTQAEVYQSPIFVTFYGIEHSGINMQGALRLSQELYNSQTRSDGSRIIFYESAKSTETTAKQLDTLVRDHGELKHAMMAICAHNRDMRTAQDPTKNFLGYDCSQIPDADVENLTQRLHTERLDTLIQDSSIPDAYVQAYFRGSAIQLCQDVGSTVLYERHSGQTIKMYKDLNKKEEDYTTEVKQAWKSQDFDKALEIEKQARRIGIQSDKQRDRENAELLRGQVKSLLRNPKGGVLDIVFGAAHSRRLQQNLHQAFRNNPRVFINERMLTQRTNPLLKTVEEDDFSDITIAQGLLISLINIPLKQYFSQLSESALFARNFETVLAEVIDIVSNTPLDEIRTICVEQQKPFEWLKQKIAA